MFLPCPDPDPGKKVRKWMNKSLFCRVQFHFFSSDFKHPLLRIIWNVKKTKKKNHFPFTPSPLPRIPPGSGSAWNFLPGSGSGSAKKNADPKPWIIYIYIHICQTKIGSRTTNVTQPNAQYDDVLVDCFSFEW